MAYKPSISDLKHPQYVLNQENWEKWRLAYLGGSRFLKRYMKKHSKREDDQDFRDRMAVSYVPAFAKSAVNEVKNSIFQRTCDVAREGGSLSYQQAVKGGFKGVDLLGSTMNAFMGREILPELLTMARVGIYVDMPELQVGTTLADKGQKRPYLYWYRAEDIRSWTLNTDRDGGDPTEFKAVLLRESTYDVDQHWVLPYDVTTRYRYMWIDPDDGYVHAQFYNQNGDYIYPDGYEDGQEIVLPIRKIPFVMLELSDSLMSDIADYQIALMNLTSTDIAFCLKANFPFYTEQEDWRVRSPHMKNAASQVQTETMVNLNLTDPAFYGAMGQPNILINQENAREVRVGVASGRTYPVGVERPGFINPSSEPLQISMAKQQQLKEEIRQLVALAITSLTPRQASAESKSLDNTSLEAGLSYIGLEMEHAERKVAEYWSMYEGSSTATVNYPSQYSLLNDQDRRAIANDLNGLMPRVNSQTFQREVAKQIASIVLSTKVSSQTLDKIHKEIDSAPVILGDPQIIEMDVQNGLVSTKTASLARGYPPGEAEEAEQDHTRRLARIAASQQSASNGDAGARGVSDLSANPNAGKEEKTASQKDQTVRDSVQDRTRGLGT